MYDLVIIGAGPAGLSLAQCCCKSKKILIIDRESTIGGCHRVRRIGNNLFTEHGPRIYSETYNVLKMLLKDMNVNFYDLFVKSEFTLTRIGNETIFSKLSFIELLYLAYEFIILLFYEDNGLNRNLGEYLTIMKFKDSSIEIIDRMCKLTDGGGIEKFTLNEFLQLFNQQFFYSLYQPKLPNDIGLLKIWKDYLTSNNVDFLLNTDIKKVNLNNELNTIESININNNVIYGKEYVFAIPPKNLNDIINYNGIKHNWGDLNKISNDTEYITYIPITFHWNQKLNLEKIYGFPKSYWGVVFVVLTDYMIFNENESKTVISTAITITDKKNSKNKTANESTQQELIDEVYSILKSVYIDLPEPSVSIISPGIYYDNKLGYKSLDTAFINTANYNPLPFKNEMLNNMYNLGTHNGQSLYKFTSLESAASNGVMLSKLICPENSKNFHLTKSKSISEIFRLTSIIIISIVVFKSYK